MRWNSRDDDNSEGLVGEGFVVAVGARSAATDGGRGDGAAGAGVDQGLDLGGDLGHGKHLSLIRASKRVLEGPLDLW